MTTHRIAGVRRSSLGAQLAGLGLVRVLAEQADPRLRCRFDGSSLLIDTTVDDLVTWLADRYVPMPVLSPWNEGSGFGAKDKAPKQALDALLGLDLSRLDPFRAAYSAVSPLAAQARVESWTKKALVVAIRNRCTDAMLPWMDAAVIALDADKLAFPPLLGSGGNDGRLEFSTSFHQRLLDVLPGEQTTRERSLRLARDWLDGTADEPLVKAAVGQFDPGAAGTPNSSPFGAAESVINPWLFVLMVEGSPLFASAPARRLDSQARTSTRAAMTFMTFGSEFGSTTGTAAEESRGEVWIPWWERSVSYPALEQLFSEGRAVWRGRTAVNSGQMYLATASRGVSPGLAGFDRYTIVKRNGLAFSAVLADEVQTRDNDAVLVVADIEDWPDDVRRRTELTATIAGALRRFGAMRVAVARATSGAQKIESIRGLLAAVTETELTVGRSGRTRGDIKPRPRPRDARNLIALFKLAEWTPVVTAPEFRIALALASIVTRPLKDAPQGRTMREILLPIDPPVAPGQRAVWRDSAIVPGLGQRDLVDVLADVAMWLVTSAQLLPDKPSGMSPAVSSTYGVSAPCDGVAAPWADLHAWVRGDIDEDELSSWFDALLAVDWRGIRYSSRSTGGGPINPTLALVAAFRAGLSGDGDDQPARYALTSEWISQLIAGHPDRVLASARQRLRQLGYVAVAVPAVRQSADTRRYGRRLAAALLPVAETTQALRCVSRQLRPPEETDKTESRPTEEIA